MLTTIYYLHIFNFLFEALYTLRSMKKICCLFPKETD